MSRHLGRAVFSPREPGIRANRLTLGLGPKWLLRMMISMTTTIAFVFHKALAMKRPAAHDPICHGPVLVKYNEAMRSDEKCFGTAWI